MNIEQFKVLRHIAENGAFSSWEITADDLRMPVVRIRKALDDLIEIGYINDNYGITQDGLCALEPFKVNNAIVLAAGMSTRFVPFSYEKPKGLTVVKGEVLIERQIRQLKEAGVEEIVLVLGHMMEKFLYLIEKYNVKVVVNNEYRYKNTHSSIYFSRDYLKNSYVCCADNYFPKSVFHKYEFHSLYSVIYMEGTWRGERGVTVDEDGLIIETQRPAVDQWVMNGFAYFDNHFSERFKTILESMWNSPGSDGLYWEQVYAEHVKELPLYAVQYTDEEVMEFDSVEELEKFDPDYIKYNDLHLTRNICSVLNCSLGDIHAIKPLKNGYTNKSFKFTCNGIDYIYRNPGKISSEWLDRRIEKEALEIARDLEIDETYIYEDPKEGWKISYYLDVTEQFSFGNTEHVTKLCSRLKRLYENPITCGKLWDYLYEAKKLLQKLHALDDETYQVAVKYLDAIECIDADVKADRWPIQMAHNDLYEDNILISGDKLYLIDWEYAGDTDISYDLCKLFVKNKATGQKIDYWLSFYFRGNPSQSEAKHIIGCAAVSFYYWYVWALYMVKNGNNYSDLVLDYFEIMTMYLREYSNRNHKQGE